MTFFSRCQDQLRGIANRFGGWKKVGCDGMGNAYYECTPSSGQAQGVLRRKVVPKDSRTMPDLLSIPTEWTMWLHRRRLQPPTDEESAIIVMKKLQAQQWQVNEKESLPQPHVFSETNIQMIDSRQRTLPVSEVLRKAEQKKLENATALESHKLSTKR